MARIVVTIVFGVSLTASAWGQSTQEAPERYGKGKVTVTNSSSKAVKISMGQVELATIAAGQNQLIENIAEGSRLLTATSEDRSLRWGPWEVYVTKDGGSWELSEESTTGLLVTNWTNQDVLITIGDEEVGFASADGGTARFMNLRPGQTKLAATTANGKLRYSPRFYDIEEDKMVEWTIGRAPSK